MSPRKPATPGEGKPDDADKLAEDAKEAKQATSTEASEAAAEDKPKAKRRGVRRKAAPKAEGTAAAATDVGKDVADAALKEGASEPVAADADETEAEATEAKTAAEVSAATAQAEPEAEEAPKPKRRGVRRKGAAEKPKETKPERKRPQRDYGDTPPMVRAHAKYVRTSARKARLVCDHIRGKSVEEARAILAHANRDVARDWSKLLESAVANAEHNHELIGDDLRIHAVKADEGPTLKRFRPRAMGRATKIRKRTSHLSITLTPKDGDR
jgi:ribosomal protein L22